MRLINSLFYTSIIFLLFLSIGFTSCEKTPALQIKTFNYTFNTGQLSPSYAYSGTHPNSLSAELVLEEMANGTTKVTVNLKNAVNGQTYMIHSHDAMPSSSTPNNTPYNEAPNSDVLAQALTISGTSGSVSQLSTMSIADLTNTYNGFFVIHDPMQNISTSTPTSFVILGSFAR